MGFDKFYDLLTGNPDYGRPDAKKKHAHSVPNNSLKNNVTPLVNHEVPEQCERVEVPLPAPQKPQRQPVEALTEQFEHPVAIEAWKEVLSTLERCIELATGEGSEEDDSHWQENDTLSSVLTRLSQRAIPVTVKQRLLALGMLLYPRLRSKDRDRLVHAFDHVPGPTRRDLQADLTLNDHDVICVRSLVNAIERSGNLGIQLSCLHRTLVRRLGLGVNLAEAAATA